jgi:hypothetical protein
MGEKGNMAQFATFWSPHFIKNIKQNDPLMCKGASALIASQKKHTS